MTVPISALALEVEVPLGGWLGVFDRESIKVLTDPAGRRAITTIDACRLLGMLRRRDVLAAEGRDRLAQEMARKHPVRAGGLQRPVEADPSMTAFEVMWRPTLTSRTRPSGFRRSPSSSRMPSVRRGESRGGKREGS